MAPEVFHRLMDPLGSAQVHSCILTSVGFSKGTTKMLRILGCPGTRVFPPGTPCKSGSSFTSNTITNMHHFTCYFSVTTVAYDDGDALVLWRSTGMQLLKLDSVFSETQTSVYLYVSFQTNITKTI